ncbi:Imm1 family immunity protein [Pseudoxanthomonas japonensis]|uniref:Imm1 family immunity protein n=1 Tax=Pseudoxanthomonas japonensis TaxID=69284 RepID=UPI003D2F99A8
MLSALISGDFGWLLYLRESGDGGFSSRNPEYDGPDDALIDCVIDNGQLDQYPASWALPLPLVMKAIEYFQSNGLPPPFIVWHNDSGDGEAPGPVA